MSIVDETILSPAAPVPGRLVVFMIARTCANLEASETVEVRTLKSAPSYPQVIPKQKVIRLDRSEIDGREVRTLVKAYLPDIVVVEAATELEDVLGTGTLDLKRRLLASCRTVLREFACEPDFDEEYSVSCISGYRGDPEVYLSLYGERIAAFLKNEDVPLDEEEVRLTLGASIKYGKDDITIVDWDGAFIFDADGDFQGDIELFEIANLQLLRSRILDDELDRRLEKTLSRLRSPRGLPLLRQREVRQILKEIIEIRTQSILDSEAVEQGIKLIGDWYSARLYALISRKFHLEEWATGIREKLQTLEDVYTMASENFSISYRATLEFVILAGWFILLLLYVAEFLFLR